VGRLRDLPESSAVAMVIKIDDYLDTMRGTLDAFIVEKDLSAIYITSTIPSQSIKNVLTILEINLNRIYFVDCISHIMMGTAVRSERVSFVESPTMLENIMLKVEFLMRSIEGKKLVLLDSINSLAIHNNTKILSEFLHIMVNNLRAKEAYTVILSVDEQSTEEINNMLGLVCDESLIFTEGK
jgi:KaiC/GvpD/RAD55 family RecA-like ATPase